MPRPDVCASVLTLRAPHDTQADQGPRAAPGTSGDARAPVDRQGYAGEDRHGVLDAQGVELAQGAETERQVSPSRNIV